MTKRSDLAGFFVRREELLFLVTQKMGCAASATDVTTTVPPPEAVGRAYLRPAAIMDDYDCYEDENEPPMARYRRIMVELDAVSSDDECGEALDDPELILRKTTMITVVQHVTDTNEVPRSALKAPNDSPSCHAADLSTSHRTVNFADSMPLPDSMRLCSSDNDEEQC